MSLDRPARAPLAFMVSCFTFSEEGKRGLPLSPPKPWKFCADASGAYCYYHCEELISQWTPPPGSTPFRTRLFKEIPCFDSPPPLAPSGITLGHQPFTPWIPLYNDSKNSIQL